ncbi:hypothetical protein ACQKWADRAFT_282279 [Trichoderma austrokoningii]
MAANPTESRDFISDLEDLEELLCCHITSSKQFPEQFTDQVADMIKNILITDRTTPHWSTRSFMCDLREEYHIQNLTEKEPLSDRGSHATWPRLSRTTLEHISKMPLTHDQGDDAWAFAVRLADQLYNFFRLQAKMPYKPFAQVLAEYGTKAPENGDDAAVCGSATDGNDDGDGEQIKDRPEYLNAKVTFLDDRVKILEKREEVLEIQLDRAAQAMAALRSTNLELAKKVSEVQKRNHELSRSCGL